MISVIGMVVIFGNILLVFFIDCSNVVVIIVVSFIWCFVDRFVFWVMMSFVMFSVIIICIEDCVRILFKFSKFKKVGFWKIIIVSSIKRMM